MFEKYDFDHASAISFEDPHYRSKMYNSISPMAKIFLMVHFHFVISCGYRFRPFHPDTFFALRYSLVSSCNHEVRPRPQRFRDECSFRCLREERTVGVLLRPASRLEKQGRHRIDD